MVDIDITRLGQKLFPARDGEGGLTLRVMEVDAVNGDGTVDLLCGAAAIPDVRRLDSSTVSPGDYVQVLVARGQMLVLGCVATS